MTGAGVIDRAAAAQRLLQALESVRRSLRTGEGRMNVEAFGRRVVGVAALRAQQGMTQQEFADSFGVSVATLREWEIGYSLPDGPAQRLLEVLEDAPEFGAALLTGAPISQYLGSGAGDLLKLAAERRERLVEQIRILDGFFRTAEALLTAREVLEDPDFPDADQIGAVAGPGARRGDADDTSDRHIAT